MRGLEKSAISLLRRCSAARHLLSAHALILAHGLIRNTSVIDGLILAACSLSLLPYAALLLHHAPTPPSTLAFNALIRAHSPSPDLALPFFLLLRNNPISSPDHLTFPLALNTCNAHSPQGPQLHALVLKNGLASADPFVITSLLHLYSARRHTIMKVFDEIPHRDNVHYNVLMTALLRFRLPSDALSIFQALLHSGLEPDAHAITTALTACSRAGALRHGQSIHRYLIKKKPRISIDDHIGCTLVTMYAKCGCIESAVKVFDRMPQRTTHVWSAIIGGLAMHGLAERAIRCLDRMRDEDGLRPDGVVILGVLAACAHSGLTDEGLRMLAGMEAEPLHEHYGCAVDMLCRVGRMEDAVKLIERMPMRPLASVWGSILAGCRTYGNVELAERAVGELQGLMEDFGRDEGVFVQLSNIYLNANKPEDARRVRRLIGSKGMKKTPGYSSVDVDGFENSFVAGDQAHPRRVEIWAVLHCLTDHSSHYYSRLQTPTHSVEDEWGIIESSSHE